MMHPNSMALQNGQDLCFMIPVGSFPTPAPKAGGWPLCSFDIQSMGDVPARSVTEKSAHHDAIGYDVVAVTPSPERARSYCTAGALGLATKPDEQRNDD